MKQISEQQIEEARREALLRINKAKEILETNTRDSQLIDKAMMYNIAGTSWIKAMIDDITYESTQQFDSKEIDKILEGKEIV